MALTHRTNTKTTAAFLSVDSRVHSKMLLEDLHAFQFHPMLLPGIMFATTSKVKREQESSFYDG